MSIRKILFLKLAIFMSVVGPGIITGSVDNDPGGITTYSVAGAKYGYNLLWTMIPSFIALLVVQEMNARMGIVTGKGLADLIRENRGVKITFFIFIALLFADIGNTATEFAGVAGSMEIFGVSKYISVPIITVVVLIMVVKASYRMIEKIFLLFSAFLLMYIVSALLAKPDWQEISYSLVAPKITYTSEYFAMVIAIIGTTIAPWMQFYMQSSVIEKGLKIEKYKYVMIDIVLGCIITIAVAFFIIVSTAATLHKNGITITEAKDAAMALKPLAGAMSSYLFALGIFVSAVFAASILPIATSFYICEAFGFEAGVDKKFNEAPQFYILFMLIILIAVIIILIPNAPLIKITVWTQVINGLLLPIVLVSMLLLVNNKEVMGKYTNNKFQNIVGGTTILILVLLSVVVLTMSIIN